TRWLAMLLTAGMIWAPAMARSQEALAPTTGSPVPPGIGAQRVNAGAKPQAGQQPATGIPTGQIPIAQEAAAQNQAVYTITDVSSLPAAERGEALPPRVVGGQEVPPLTDPTFPLPLYHDRPEKGGFYAAAEFMYFRQTNPLDHQVIAVRGLLDFDGSITAD